MALPSSGPLSLLDIQNEFSGSNPISISEYYGAATGVPTSGTISISDFYGTSSALRWLDGAYNNGAWWLQNLTGSSTFVRDSLGWYVRANYWNDCHIYCLVDLTTSSTLEVHANWASCDYYFNFWVEWQTTSGWTGYNIRGLGGSATGSSVLYLPIVNGIYNNMRFYIANTSSGGAGYARVTKVLSY